MTILENEKLRKLKRDYGAKGVGLYFVMRFYLAECNDYTMLLSALKKKMRLWCSFKTFNTIILNYDLFSIENDDAQALIRTRDLICPRVPLEGENNIFKEKEKERTPSDDATMKWEKGMFEHYPNVAMMMKPLTREEYNKLLHRGYANQKIVSLLERLDNLPDLNKRYISTYRVLLNWLEK